MVICKIVEKPFYIDESTGGIGGAKPLCGATTSYDSSTLYCTSEKGVRNIPVFSHQYVSASPPPSAVEDIDESATTSSVKIDCPRGSTYALSGARCL